MERNSRCSSSVRMRNPTPLFSLGLWRNKAIMATPEQKAFCVLQFVKHDQLFLFTWHFGDNSTVILHLPIALDAGISSFRQRGAFVKEKVQDGRVCQKKVWNEWDSLFFAVRRKETFVGMYQTCRVTLSFLLVFISLFTTLVNIINFQTAPIILIHLYIRILRCMDPWTLNAAFLVPASTRVGQKIGLHGVNQTIQIACIARSVGE